MSTITNDLISYLVCGEAIAANDAIYIDSSDGKVYKFDVNNATEVFAGIAKESGVLDDYIRVVQSGRVKGFTGLTPGVFIYASTTTPGGYQEVEPVASLKVVLGIAKSATELVINGGLGIKPGGEGSGGGGLDVYYTEDVEGLADVSGFSTGNNAAFQGGGTLQGTLALETSTQIAGTKSLSYTQAAGSLNDYFASEVIDVDFKQQGNDSGMTFYFTYDGNEGDGRFIVWDETNDVEIQNEAALVEAQSGAARYSLSFFVPSDCDEVRWGYQVEVENIGAELILDDIEFSTNPFVYKNLSNDTNPAEYTPSNTQGFGTLGTSRLEWSRQGKFLILNGTFTAGTVASSEAQIELPPGLTIDLTGIASNASAVGHYFTNQNSADNGGAVLVEDGNTYVNFSENTVFGATASVANTPANGDTVIATGGVITFNALIPIAEWQATVEHVITPVKSNLSNSDNVSEISLDATTTAPTKGTIVTDEFRYRRVGDRMEFFITFEQSAGGSGGSGQYLIDLPDSLVIDATKEKVPASVIEAENELGTGRISDNTNGYSSFTLPVKICPYNTTQLAVFINNDAAGNLRVSEAPWGSSKFNLGGGQVTLSIRGSVAIEGWSSDVTFLAAVPTSKTVYVKDIKATTVSGGGFTAGAWQPRTLNTIIGDTGFASLASDIITLQPGKYKLTAKAVGNQVDNHQIKLVRDPSGSPIDVVFGTNAKASSSDLVQNMSELDTTVTVTSATEFALQHYCETTNGTDGFGEANSFGGDEVYASITIEKIG